MLRETETEERVGFFVTFSSLMAVAFYFAHGVVGTLLATGRVVVAIAKRCSKTATD